MKLLQRWAHFVKYHFQIILCKEYEWRFLVELSEEKSNVGDFRALCIIIEHLSYTIVCMII